MKTIQKCLPHWVEKHCGFLTVTYKSNGEYAKREGLPLGHLREVDCFYLPFKGLPISNTAALQGRPFSQCTAIQIS